MNPRRYGGYTAHIGLIIAALGWLFDTMDQNIFNLVRQQSITAGRDINMFHIWVYQPK